jgi:hypothetical protein
LNYSRYFINRLVEDEDGRTQSLPTRRAYDLRSRRRMAWDLLR